MIRSFDRRLFLQGTAALTAAAVAGQSVFSADKSSENPLFKISLAQWSLNGSFFKFLGQDRRDKPLDPQDFGLIAKNEFGIEAVEFVNQFYREVVHNAVYLNDLKKKNADAGVRNVLIMVDGEGNLGDPDKKKRVKAVVNHVKWLGWAAELGCHSIRVNASSSGSYEQQQELAADGLSRLTEIGEAYGIDVIVENHGGLSSNGKWLSGVMKMVDSPHCGTLPDLGNFYISRGENPEQYDRYLGTEELMPFAKGVSAKTYAFDTDGNETTIDYARMLKIVDDANFHGFIGIEYEGNTDAFQGIRDTKALLERLRTKMSA